MFCGKCGAEIPENAQFCAHCGTEVVSVAVANKQLSKSDRKKVVISIVCISAVILLGAIGGLLLFPKLFSEKTSLEQAVDDFVECLCNYDLPSSDATEKLLNLMPAGIKKLAFGEYGNEEQMQETAFRLIDEQLKRNIDEYGEGYRYSYSITKVEDVVGEEYTNFQQYVYQEFELGIEGMEVERVTLQITFEGDIDATRTVIWMFIKDGEAWGTINIDDCEMMANRELSSGS